jgi:GH35 family endo-1,4-beta-xylanase
MATLKSAAARLGIRLGVGPVDTTGPLVSIEVEEGVFWDYRYARPLALNVATDPEAALIVNEFGGALDLCGWAIGNTDLSHYGQPARWTGPGVYSFTGCDEAYAWALANGMKVWISDPAYSGTPQWILSGGYTPAQITALLHDWYIAFYSRYPLAYATTLCNEMLPLTYNPNASGPGGHNIEWYYQNSSVGVPGGFTRLQFIKTVYEWVKAITPSIKIVMNQHSCEGVTPASVTNAGVYRLWIQDLLALGAPFDMVGFQSHFFSASTAYNAAGFKATLQSFAQLGVEVCVTEFDILNNHANWATHHYNLLRAIAESGVVTDLTFWSIRDPLFYMNGDSGARGALYTETLVATAARASAEQAFNDAALSIPGPLHSRTVPVGGSASWTVEAA